MNKGGGRPSEELRHFTNREDEKKVFTAFVNGRDGENLPLLMFYGVGGIGKTWLTKKLRQLLGETPFVGKTGDKPVPSARLDMDVSGGGGRYHQDAASAYAEIRRQFGVECPSFDLAYAMLRYKQGVREEAEFRHGGAFHNAWECVCEGSNAAVSSVPGGTFFVWMGKKVSQKIGKELQDTAFGKYVLSVAGNKEFFELRGMDVDDLYRVLPQRLGADLDAHLPERKGHGCKGVLVLDTLEALTAGLENDAQQYERVRWIASLYENLNHVLLVMAGRDRLTWGEVDGDWNNPACLEQHLVGGLSWHDAGTFLGWCGVTDSALQNAVLRVCVDVDAQKTARGDTPYHPYSLGLCADTIAQERNRGVTTDTHTFDMAPGDYDRLAQRFLKSLANDAEADWITRLALPVRFDEAAARHAFSPTPSALQNVAWENLKDYSFVTAPDGEGWRTLHPRMREALRKRLADPTKPGNAERSHSDWFHYWADHSHNETDNFAALAWYHLWCLKPAIALNIWSRLVEQTRSGAQPNMTLHHHLLNWWQHTGIETQISRVAAVALNNLGVQFCHTTQGNHHQNLRQAFACYEAALRISTYTAFPRDWAMTQNNMANTYRDFPVGNREQNLQRAISCYEEALRVYTETDFPKEWAMTQTNLGTVFYFLPSGDREQNLQRAITYHKAASRAVTEVNAPNEWAKVQNNLGSAYAALSTGNRQENLQHAISCYEAALRIFTKDEFPQDWAGINMNLGILYADSSMSDQEKNHKRAISNYEAALNIYTETSFPEQWAMIQHNLGNAYYVLRVGDRKRHLQSAIACYEASLQVYTEADFPMDYGESHVSLGSAYASLGQTAQAREHFLLAVGGYKAAGLPPEWERRAYAERRLREL